MSLSHGAARRFKSYPLLYDVLSASQTSFRIAALQHIRTRIWFTIICLGVRRLKGRKCKQTDKHGVVLTHHQLLGVYVGSMHMVLNAVCSTTRADFNSDVVADLPLMLSWRALA